MVCYFPCFPEVHLISCGFRLVKTTVYGYCASFCTSPPDWVGSGYSQRPNRFSAGAAQQKSNVGWLPPFIVHLHILSGDIFLSWKTCPKPPAEQSWRIKFRSYQHNPNYLTGTKEPGAPALSVYDALPLMRSVFYFSNIFLILTLMQTAELSQQVALLRIHWSWTRLVTNPSLCWVLSQVEAEAVVVGRRTVVLGVW